MPLVIQCPNPKCGTSARVPDSLAGQSVKCKKCSTPFKAVQTLHGEKSETRGSSPSSPGDPFPGLPAEFGRYRVLKKLGQGGMGAVYLAEDTQLGRQVALKLPNFDASETRRVERFVREAKASAGLMHAHICPVFDAGTIDGRPFISMGYIDGKPLEDSIDPDAPMDQREAAGTVRKIASALQEAHEKGIVHRDLKPANVMMNARGEPVVMDFGLAKRVAEVDPHEAKLTRDGAVLGTPSYMAPEQVKGEQEKIGPATDVYALGVMLFEMLTGKTPYRGTLGVVMGQILTSPVPPVSEYRPDVDPRLEAACKKAMAKDPAERFPGMAAFSKALARYLEMPSQASIAAAPVVPTPFEQMVAEEPAVPSAKAVRRKPPQSKKPLVVAAGIFGLLLAVAGVVFTFKTKHGDVVIELNDPKAKVEVKVDGDRIDIAGLEKPLSLTAGEHGLTISGSDFETVTRQFTVKKGATEVVKVTLKPKPSTAKQPSESQPALAPYTNAIGMAFVPVPKGKSWLGGGGGKFGDREVEIEQDFYLGKYPVTQGEWQSLMGKNPSHFSRSGAGKDAVKDLSDEELKRQPVETVSMEDCKEFIIRVNERLKETGWVYRLPTEDEWEYACRGGPMTDRVDSTFDYYCDKPSNELLPSQANFNKGNGGRTNRVDAFKPNKLGLHDMHGNVHQYCVASPDAPAGKTEDVIRGGSYWSQPVYCRAARRGFTTAAKQSGLRLARVPGETAPAPQPAPVVRDFKPGQEVEFEIAKGIKTIFCWIPAGEAQLGSPKDEMGRGDDEDEAKRGLFKSKGFWLAKHPVTQREYEAVAGNNPSWFSKTGPGKDLVAGTDTARFPVEQVSWDETQAFVKKLNDTLDMQAMTRAFGGKATFVLPHEDEWEYACRGGKGNKPAFYFGDVLKADKANHNGSFPYASLDTGPNLGRTTEVGSYEKAAPHPWGLCDMAGNVYQWCDNAVDSAGRAVRGGCWGGTWRGRPKGGAGSCRSAAREFAEATLRSNNTGFRLAVHSVATVVGASPIKAKPRPAADRTLAARYGGDWKIEGNELVQSKDGPTTILFGDKEWADYDFSFETLTNGKAGTVAVGGVAVFRAVDLENLYSLLLGGYGGKWTELNRWTDNKWFRDVESFPKDYLAERWYKVRVRLRGTRITCHVDDQQAFDFDDAHYTKGRPGLRTWNAGARFRAIKVTAPDGTVLWDGLPDLTQAAASPKALQQPAKDRKPNLIWGGDWRIDGKDLVQSQINRALIYFGDPSWTDYDFTFESMTSSKTPKNPVGAIAAFRVEKAEARYYALTIAGPGEVNDLITVFDAQKTERAKPVPFKLETDRWYKIKISVRGDRIRCELDGKEIFDHKEARLPSGSVSLASWFSIIRYRDIKVTAPDGTVLWEGLPDVPAVAVPAPTTADDYLPLFNGKDLTGWKLATGQPASWNVEAGVLTAQGGAKMSHLVSDASYRNFHLRAEYRVNAAGNSGILFRTAGAVNAGGFPAGGYEAQINHSGRNGPPTGSLYRLGKGAVAVRDFGKPDEWTTMEVIAVGDRMAITVNGQLTQDYTDPDKLFPAGPFMIQQHDAATKVEFRKIEVRKFDDAALASKVDEFLKTGRADPFQEKSVWTGVENGTAHTLTVTERKGEAFKARFVIGGRIEREFAGTCKDDKVSWLAKDVKIVKGSAGGDNFGTLSKDKDGDLINFNWKQGAAQGTFVLRLLPAK